MGRGEVLRVGAEVEVEVEDEVGRKGEGGDGIGIRGLESEVEVVGREGVVKAEREREVGASWGEKRGVSGCSFRLVGMR